MDFEYIVKTFDKDASPIDINKKMKILITAYVNGRKSINKDFSEKNIPLKYRKLLTGK